MGGGLRLYFVFKIIFLMDLAEYKEKDMLVDVWNIFPLGVFVLICKECRSFLILKSVDLTKGIK